LQPTFRDAQANGIRIWNESEAKNEEIKIEIATCEADDQAKNYASEHLGVNTRENCHKCHNSGVPNKKGYGSYQRNYLNRIALTCDKKKTTKNAVEPRFLLQLKRFVTFFLSNFETQVHGIGEPSRIALNLPNFNIVDGWIIEYFHKFLHNFPETFFGQVFQEYKKNDVLEIWVMEKKNRLIFQKRILAMIPTHDMGKKLKDPWKNKMKAEDWMNFIVTASVEALDGLVDDRVLSIWKNFQKGFNIHTQRKLITPEDRNDAKTALFQVGVGCEEITWEKMLTLATHQIAVEADRQISKTGPIRESLGAWIERLCF